MSPKSRHHNRGSRSFLSKDLLRSIARGRSHSDIGILVSDSDFRSQSSLSCNPNTQSGSETGSAQSLRHAFSGLSAISAAAISKDVGTRDAASASPSAVSKNNLSRQRNRQRLSWLSNSWSRASRDGKSTLFKNIGPAASVSSMSGNSISSPTLNSTTNLRLAKTGKLKHEEVLLPASPASEIYSRSGVVHIPEDTGGLSATGNSPPWTSSVSTFRAKVNHTRRASEGLVLRTSLSHGEKYSAGVVDGPSVLRFRKGRMARCKEKLHHINERLHAWSTGSGSDAGAPVTGVKAKGIQTQDFQQLSATPTPRATSYLPKLHSDSTTDLLRGSLSRSFASAIDKLDINSSPTLVNHSPSMAPLRKAKSVLDLFSKYKETDQSKNDEIIQSETDTTITSNENKAGISGGDNTDVPFSQEPEAEQSSNDNGTFFGLPGRNGDDDDSDKNKTRDDSKAGGEYQKDNCNANGKISKPSVPGQVYGKPAVNEADSDNESIPPMPATPRPAFARLYTHKNGPIHRFERSTSATASRTSPHEPVETRSLLGGIQPGALTSHPNVTSFATPGRNEVPTIPSQPISSNPVNQGAEKREDDSDELEEGPMYTPETRVLRHYTRTPSPIIKKPAIAPIRPRIPAETPTKQPVFNKLKKSISTFFSKPNKKEKPAAAATTTEEEKEEENEEKIAVPAPARGPYDPITPSPLRNEAGGVRQRRGTITSEERRRGGADWAERMVDYEKAQKHVTAPYE